MGKVDIAIPRSVYLVRQFVSECEQRNLSSAFSDEVANQPVNILVIVPDSVDEPSNKYAFLFRDFVVKSDIGSLFRLCGRY